MKIITLALCLILSTVIYAQKSAAIYTHNGSKYIGSIVSRDSVTSHVKIKIRGGTEFSIPFNEIDSINTEFNIGEQGYGEPYFGFGLGVAMNSTRNLFQFDVVMGYQFTHKIHAGLGICVSELIASYADLHYYPYHKRFYAIGFYTNPGVVLTARLNDWSYGGDSKKTGFYSNTGISLKLFGDSKACVSLNVGYQYISKKETYTYYTGQEIVEISNLNRYIVQGIFTF